MPDVFLQRVQEYEIFVTNMDAGAKNWFVFFASKPSKLKSKRSNHFKIEMTLEMKFRSYKNNNDFS